MKCTVCQRELAPNLSLCVRCGAMVNDSVREEMASSITPIASVSNPRKAAAVIASPELKPPPPPMPETEPKPRRLQTADLPSKKTSPTLAEFRNPNPVIPDWRIQLQNTVRQRTGRSIAESEALPTPVQTMHPSSRGANALKLRQEPEAEGQVDAKVANALKRIEQSRKRYLPSEKAREGVRVARAAAAARNYPFNVISRSTEPDEAVAQKPAQASGVRPRLVSSMRIEKKSYDTNKLVPIPEAAYMADDLESTGGSPEPKPVLKENWSEKIEIKRSTATGSIADPEPLSDVNSDADEIDDLAPISMRFNSGLFDLIIGGVASMLLFSPFVGLYEGWASLTGALLFASILMVVMFVYLTATLVFLGQTFGMKLFALELVDAEQSEFPTLHQAAVSSSVYLLSLVFGGVGFLPVLFNEEKRAAHDIASGTILVRAV